MADQDRFDDREQERALVARVREGDPQAIAILMRLYASRLVRFASYTVGSRDTAEDIVQQVFVKLWERRATLDSDFRIKPYLFRAVRNRALDELDAETVRTRYQTSVQGEVVAGVIPAMVPSPEEGVLTTAAIQAALERLPERHRLALRLRLEQQMTHAEIAEVLGISVVATKRFVARAIGDLRKMLWGY
jgi:RNA polymerase sigma-70 factor (ECF subfamily)